MNESAWLEATEPKPMREALQGKASERKLRLFAVTVCRRIWRLLEDGRIRRAVEVAERQAETSSATPSAHPPPSTYTG